MVKNISILLAIFALGWVFGSLGIEVIEVEVPYTVEKKVYNFTDCPPLKDMEIYANFLGKTLENRDDIEKRRHQIWQSGYQQGYNAGMIKSESLPQ
jgi:hypothetical protein